MGALRTILSGLLSIALLAPAAAAVTGSVALSGHAANSGDPFSMLPHSASGALWVSVDTDAATPVSTSGTSNVFAMAQTVEATPGWIADGQPEGDASYTLTVTAEGEPTSVTLP